MKNWKERHVYYFHCTECLKRRQTLKRSRAKKGICRACRKGKVPDNQLGLFTPTL